MRSNYIVRAYNGDTVLCNVKVPFYHLACNVRDSISAFPSVKKIRILPIYNGREF